MTCPYCEIIIEEYNYMLDHILWNHSYEINANYWINYCKKIVNGSE